MSARILTLVLPFEPQERQSHDHAIAAAAALCRAGSGDAVEVLQLTPAPGAVPARADSPHVRWWNIIHPAVAEASATMVSRLVEQALGATPLRQDAARLILLPAATLSEEATALVASALGAVTLGRCSRLALEGGDVVATRMAFGGRLEVRVRSDAAVCCATWRPGPSTGVLQPLPPGQVSQLPVEVAPEPALDTEILPSADQQARIEGARLVVSGGRGIGGPEGFELLGQVARSLGGAVGGSLPAVDAGWVPVARQVGVSGKFVTPHTYFAVGISGTPQHLWGVATTSRLIALNQDAEAPIFRVADVGVVGDWREVLPLLLQELG